jgi:ABC-2 type transport system permease protein
MLSGTFYSVTSLSPAWQKFVLLNPVFYIIEGFRFGMIGVGEGNFFGGLMILALIPIFGFWAMKSITKGLRV